jgi:hypothetical protein
MANEITPLSHNSTLVDDKGRPTPLFILQWQLLLQEVKELRNRLSALEAE